jgi:two-component system, NarL family, sensor kinase
MYKNLLVFIILSVVDFATYAQKNKVSPQTLANYSDVKLEKYLKAAEGENDTLAMAYGYSALANRKKSEPNLRFEAVELALKSIDYFHKHDDEQKNWQKVFLANLFNENQDSKLSLEYAGVLADSILRFANIKNDPKLKMAALQVIFRIGSEVKDLKVSQAKAILICDSLVNNNRISDLGLLKMHYYFKANFESNKDLNKADSLYQLCKKYAILQKDTLITSHCYIHASYIYRTQQKFQKAIQTITTNVPDTVLDKFPDLAKWVYQELAQNYAGLGNAKLSNEYWNLYFKKANEISDKNFKKYKLSELIDRHLSKKQILENERLKETNQQNVSMVKKYKYYLILLPVLFLLIFGAFLFRSNWNKMMDKNLKNSILLEGQELERNRLSKELHDSVGSSLAAIKNTIYFKEKSVENKQLLMLIDDLYLKVRDISHQVYPSFLITDGLVIALNDYIKMIDKEGKISFTFFGNEPKIEANKLLNIFRIIQELLNNAIKHAEASKIEVELLFEKRELFIRVQDNGIGLALAKESDGIGLKNINNRINAIKAEIESISEPGNGSTFLIRIQNT